jgi:prepilin-type N-terminal cleavage/methylation domain-containing protein
MELSAALRAKDISSPVGRRCAGVNVARCGCQGPWSGDTQKNETEAIQQEAGQGFALVELIAVVSVILILVAIVVPASATSRQSG